MNDPYATRDEFDFKPFFDLIVGMLFILLIMISAQLFFTQWDRPSSDIESRRTAELREAETAQILGRMAERLEQAGYPSTVNRDARNISVSLPLLDGTLPIVLPAAATTLGKAAHTILGCAVAHGKPPGECPAYGYVVLTGIGLGLSLPSHVPGTDDLSRAGALALAADLVRQTPALLLMKTSDGRSVFEGNLVTPGSSTNEPGRARLLITLVVAPQPN
jgi:hypothetical protein